MAEGGGLLNRYRGSTSIVSSNLIPSARYLAAASRHESKSLISLAFQPYTPGRHGPPDRASEAGLIGIDCPNVLRQRVVSYETGSGGRVSGDTTDAAAGRAPAHPAMIKQARQPGKFADGNGLWLIVDAPNRRYWQFRYQWQGRDEVDVIRRGRPRRTRRGACAARRGPYDGRAWHRSAGAAADSHRDVAATPGARSPAELRVRGSGIPCRP